MPKKSATRFLVEIERNSQLRLERKGWFARERAISEFVADMNRAYGPMAWHIDDSCDEPRLERRRRRWVSVAYDRVVKAALASWAREGDRR